MERAQQARAFGFAKEGAAAFCKLPADILWIILQKLSFKERLLLEMANKEHQTLLRPLRSWRAINLEAMHATDLSERQLLSLLGKLHPEFERASPQIKCMAAIAEGFSRLVRKKRSEYWVPSYHDLAFDGRVASTGEAAQVRYQYVHEQSQQIGVTLPGRLYEWCAVSSAEVFDWLLQVGRKVGKLFLPASTHAASNLESSGEVVVSEHPEKLCIFLNTSGASRLSPSFLAACIIGLSAAGFKVDFKMNGANDIPFLLNPIIELLQIFTAGDCTFYLNLGVSTRWIPGALEEALEEYAVSSEESGFCKHQCPQTPLAGFLGRPAEVTPLKSRTLYNNSLNQLLKLAHLRQEIEALFKHPVPFNCSTKSQVVTKTIFFKDFSSAGEIVRFLQRHPDAKLRLKSERSYFFPEDVSSLCKAVGRSAVFHLSFQSSEKINPKHHSRWKEAIFTSAALQESDGLQILEIDFPLCSADADAMAHFLKEAQQGVQIWVHLRPSFWSTSEEAAPILSRLAAMRTEWGTRLKTIPHRAASRVFPISKRPHEPIADGMSHLAPSSIAQALALKRRGEWLDNGVQVACGLIFAIPLILKDNESLSWGAVLMRLVRFVWGFITCLHLKFSVRKFLRGKQNFRVSFWYFCFSSLPWLMSGRFLSKLLLLWLLFCLTTTTVLKRFLAGQTNSEEPSTWSLEAGNDPFLTVVEHARSEFNERGEVSRAKHFWGYSQSELYCSANKSE